MATPALVGDDGPAALERLAELPWLQELGTTEVIDFLTKRGLKRAEGIGMTSLPGNLLLDALRQGNGVSVVARAFVDADIAAGRLLELYCSSERESCFLVTRPGVLRPAARAFTTWIRRQAS